MIIYIQTIDDVYEKLDDYNPTKKTKVLIVFDDILADMELIKKLSHFVTEFFHEEENSTFHLFLYGNPISKVPKTIRLNGTHFIMKILNKKELQQITSNHSSNTEFKDFMKPYKDYTKEAFLFLVHNTTLPSEIPLRFRKNIS